MFRNARLAGLVCSARRAGVVSARTSRAMRLTGGSRGLSGLHSNVNITVKQIEATVPKFAVDKGQIQVLYDPEEFYDQLKQKILSAKERVFLSTLYVGKEETELVSCLDEALTKNSDLKVSVLIDGLRGTREEPETCSASLLASLLHKHGDRVDIRCYITPHLFGLKKQLIPKRFNEGWGLQHMKLYGCDDDIILSGANLSRDYFTNRQDRYFVFKSRPIVDYYHAIHNAVCKLSWRVALPKPEEDKPQPGKIAAFFKKQAAAVAKKILPEPEPVKDPGFVLEWPSNNTLQSPNVSLAEFQRQATASLAPLITSKPVQTGRRKVKSIAERESEETPESEAQTLVFPISQFTPLLKPDSSTEFPTLGRLLSMLSMQRSSWTFTAGYFNMHPEFKAKLLGSVPDKGTVITASPQANGFYKSHGISQFLPDCYTLLARQFIVDVNKAHRQKEVELLEWQRGTVNTPGGWSYHAKGIWINGPGDKLPSITVVGSSNYTRRGYSKDLETNALIVTTDEELKRQLQQEIDHIERYTTKKSIADYDQEDRQVQTWVKVVAYFIGDKL
ncbi:CDP-diacylglycerol--glycerol-3-phosphate 3-phosphatidyltransferase [Yarrowia sp. B02]|nr:CDP-diacylglycerol--glycerol-3-phosphate 3-phosphatidyltransferase [Yarrowia sp. B02]